MGGEWVGVGAHRPTPDDFTDMKLCSVLQLSESKEHTFRSGYRAKPNTFTEYPAMWVVQGSRRVHRAETAVSTGAALSI